MTDGQQIALAIVQTVIPTLTVLVGIMMNNRQVDSFRGEMRREFELTRELFTEKLRRDAA